MKVTSASLLITSLLLIAASSLAAPSVAATTSDRSGPTTPNSCIRLNQGDFNACNVGNSGAGNLPYRAVAAGASNTPDACIGRNQGDSNACNVGNSGAGGLPYLVPIR